MKLTSFFIVILVIFLILVGAFLFIFRYSKIPPSWPYIFNLKNLGGKSQTVRALINSSIYKTYTIGPGENVKVLVGDNVENPMTNMPFQKFEIFSIAFQLTEAGNIHYSSPNVFRAPAFSGSSCKKNCFARRGEENGETVYFFTQAGYYTILLQ